MASSDKRSVTIEEVREVLINYSMDRQELNFLMGTLPESREINPVAVEYEIQILKIISVGWGISYFMVPKEKKKELAEAFWNSIRDVSLRISSATSASTGKDIDYFGILKGRLDLYIDALSQNPEASDPVHVIGPTFARISGHECDPHVILAGSKAFSLALGGVKAYLESVEFV